MVVSKTKGIFEGRNAKRIGKKVKTKYEWSGK